MLVKRILCPLRRLGIGRSSWVSRPPATLNVLCLKCIQACCWRARLLLVLLAAVGSALGTYALVVSVDHRSLSPTRFSPRGTHPPHASGNPAILCSERQSAPWCAKHRVNKAPAAPPASLSNPHAERFGDA
eukprot:1194651-Prorocentrum_minimum.AAC.10